MSYPVSGQVLLDRIPVWRHILKCLNIGTLKTVWRHILKCLNIGTLKTINFPFVPNDELMIFRCPNI